MSSIHRDALPNGNGSLSLRIYVRPEIQNVRCLGNEPQLGCATPESLWETGE